MAEVTTERVRQAWGDVHAWSITCGTKPTDFFPEFDAWHRKELAKAWEEGYLHATGHKPEQDCWATNPYKEAL